MMYHMVLSCVHDASEEVIQESVVRLTGSPATITPAPNSSSWCAVEVQGSYDSLEEVARELSAAGLAAFWRIDPAE